MWQRLKNWILRKPQEPEGDLEFDHNGVRALAGKYSTSVRTTPVELALELAFIPRWPAKPEDCSDELFEETLEAVRMSLKGNLPDGRLIYYPRQRELYVRFPEDKIFMLRDGQAQEITAQTTSE